MPNVWKKIDKYLAVTRVSIKNVFAYVREMAYRSTFMIVILFVFIKLWGVAFADHQSIAGITYEQTLWYLVVTEAIIMSKISIGNVISREVISGSLAYTLGRPYNYLLYHFFNGFGESIIRLAINVIAGSTLVFLFVGPPAVELWVVFPVMITILFAIIIDFLITAMISFLAFFTEEVSGFFFVYQKILFILGGLLIPIDFFPEWLQEFSGLLPFQLILYAPAKLFINFSVETFNYIILQQFLWMFALGVTLGILFLLGKRRLSVNGG
ncbi:ABC transporter permease [Chengkuizengella marina]|uniref:ABC transporter permease n=1 Tax=Chengkuizengella marina TaxID=2507566 RepID=A0A6N9Q8W6_9BACL|nr:ABC-2 family transporter protein [Chengkuizengella marina]NBI31083.1 ABC transporter permease [Chengkuizengella marina]